MIRYYLSATETREGRTKPTANIGAASRTSVKYDEPKTTAGIMAEVTDEQHASILESGASEFERADLAGLGFDFPADWPALPSYGA